MIEIDNDGDDFYKVNVNTIIFFLFQKFEKEKEVAMELKERKIPSSPIKHILDVLKTLNVDSRKQKEAKKQYDMIMSQGLSSYPEVL